MSLQHAKQPSQRKGPTLTRRLQSHHAATSGAYRAGQPQAARTGYRSLPYTYYQLSVG